jgi:adenylosuccinate lyase
MAPLPVATSPAATSSAGGTGKKEFALTALTPLDGRYGSRVAELGNYFSEYALIRYRVMVEVEYFIELCGILPQLARAVPPERFAELRRIYETFDVADALEIKAIESVTNHDVKAVEYFLKRHFDELGLGSQKEFIHFALTSQDVNNVALPLMLKHALAEVYAPLLRKFLGKLRDDAAAWDAHPMLARTHGQPATPTRLGKEMMVFVERTERQLVALYVRPVQSSLVQSSPV